MAVDMFLKIDKISGESTDDKHKGEIDILAWSWGASQSGTMHVGGGGGGGKASFQDISITKFVDKASPELLKHVATGTHIANMTLIVRKAGGTPLEYITYSFEKVLVSSVSTGGSGGEDRLTENVSFNFGKVKFKYIEQTPTGGEGSKPEYGYDIAANKQW